METSVLRIVYILTFTLTLRLHNVIGRKVELDGAGASFPNQVYERWIAGYKHYRSQHVYLDMTYESIGSGGGKARIQGHTTPHVQFAGSDYPLTPDEQINNPDLVQFPTIAGSKRIMSVSSDGGWQRRGTGHSHNSLSGHVTMVGRYSKKCLKFAVAKKTCRFCTVAKRRKKAATHHCCRKNWNGSAKGMEPHLTVTCLKSLQEKDFKVSHITMDDDTSTFTRVRRSILPDLIKCSDKNHVVRNMTNELYKLRATHKTLSVTVINYLKKCFSYAIAQNSDDVDGMKRNISAIIPHAFGQHLLCQPSWCRAFDRKEAYVHSSLPGGKDLDGIELRQALEKVFSSYMTEVAAEKLSMVQSSNSNENLNYLISRKAPKSMHFSDSESLDFRVSAAVAQKNDGHEYIEKVIDETGLSPGKFTSKRTKALELKKQKRSRSETSVHRKRRRLQLKQQRFSNEAQNELYEGTTYKTSVESEDTIRNEDIDRIPEPIVNTKKKAEPGQPSVKKDNIIVFDLETTGLGTDSSIIQIAAQHMISEDKFTTYVKPRNGYIPSLVSRLTGIDCHGNVMFHYSNPVASISLHQALTQFTEWLQKYDLPILVAHNAHFDSRLLVAGFQAARIHFPPNVQGFSDSLTLLRTTNPGLKSYKLESLMKSILGTSFTAHDATQDVYALIEILKTIPEAEDKLIVFSQGDVSFKLEQLSNEKSHLGSYQTLIQNKAISKASAKSLARSGLSASHLKIAFDRQGIDGLKTLVKKVISRSVVLAYNIPNLSNLTLSMETIVGIYNGTFRRWDDPEIQKLNPNTTMPAEDITVLARSDKSGTTYAFTYCLSSYSEEWRNEYGLFSHGLDSNRQPISWNDTFMKFYGNTNDGMSGMLVSLVNSIGYMSIADAIKSDIPYANIQKSPGHVVRASVESVQKAIMYANGSLDIANTPGPDSYPFASFTFIITRQLNMADCDAMVEFVRFIEWSFNNDIPRQDTVDLFMVPLDMDTVNSIITNTLMAITCDGQNVWNKYLQQLELESQEPADTTWMIPVYGGIGVVIALFVTFAILFGLQQYRMHKELLNDTWRLSASKIIIDKVAVEEHKKQATNKSSKSTNFKQKQVYGERSLADQAWLEHDYIQGIYNDSVVMLCETDLFKMSLKEKKAALFMRDNIKHVNVMPFVGLTLHRVYYLSVYSESMRGTLLDVLSNQKYQINKSCIVGFIKDLADGMKYLHKKGIIHGNLRGSNCMVDGAWNLKVTGWCENVSVLDSIIESFEGHVEILEQRLKESEDEKRKIKINNRAYLNHTAPACILDKLHNNVEVGVEKVQDISAVVLLISNIDDVTSRVTQQGIFNTLKHFYKGVDENLDKDVYIVERHAEKTVFATGLPTYTERHGENACRLALNLQTFCRKFNKQHLESVKAEISYKLGVSSSSALSGVVSTNIPRYTVIGSCFEVAARLAMSADTNTIRLAPSTYEDVKYSHNLSISEVLNEKDACYQLNEMSDRNIETTVHDIENNSYA